MARYFFHLRDGQDVLIDPEGREIADPSQIPGLALKEARSLISQDVMAGQIRLDFAIDVLDETGSVAHHLAFREAVAIVGGRQPASSRTNLC